MYLDLDPRPFDERIQDLAHGHALAGTYVVDRSANAFREKQQVGLDHLPHIRKVTDGVQVADLDDRGGTVQFDLGDLPGERSEALLVAQLRK